jgi:hypothetical protein
MDAQPAGTTVLVPDFPDRVDRRLRDPAHADLTAAARP